MMAEEQGGEAEEAGWGQIIMGHACSAGKFNFFLKTRRHFKSGLGLLFIKVKME